ncbi:MAG: DUF2723 domain-containing protein [Bacteroidota bacterium]
MNHIRTNRIVAGVVFAFALIVYILTLSSTVVFWDVGEFIAAAKMLQVPHPPGSPLFLLGARVMMMIPYAADQAVRAHAFSAVLSAAAILLFYLMIIELFQKMRAVPEAISGKVAYYGAAAIGAWSLAFTTTYWDNSIEAEVYGASMFLVTMILWLAMRWHDKADEPGNEKYVMMIAYLIGLSLGVHLLALLIVIPVLMIIYFRRYEFNFRTAVYFTLISLVVFFTLYPGLVKILPGLMDGEVGGTHSVLIAWIPWIVILLLIYGTYRAYQKKQKMLHLALLSSVLILLGYSTYVMVIIRANADLPMNENDPSNLERLTSYLSREQYGNQPLFMPRRWSQEAHQQGIYTNYSSDMDYLIRYQLNHMFFRYVGWNFVGAAGDVQDSGVDWSQTLGIPLFLALFGLYYQVRKDWKMGMVFIVLFIIMGPILALYQNQQEPQPRERDYFYVGAYMVLSTWIAYAIFGLYELVIEGMKKLSVREASTYLLVGASAIAVPANLMRINYHDHNRTGNYVAWDYSYNMLQTCEKDAILFTNGDNDTFPLWYLQDVEGVRRDVRIVNLSLVNTPWYIEQMKKKPYYAEAQAVPISLSDQRIDNIQATVWRARKIDLPVPPDAYESFGITDTADTHQGKIEFTMQPTLRYGDTQAIRVQDIMVLDIVRTNQWKRPIYFAVTCAPDSRIGLDNYLWFCGLAYRLEPRKVKGEETGIEAKIVEENLFGEPQGFSKTPQYGYKLRGVSDPRIYFDENITRLMINLRYAYIKLANYYAYSKNDMNKAATILDRMEETIPRSKVEMGWELTSDLAMFYHRIGREQKFNQLSLELEPQLRAMVDNGQYNLNSYWNPFRVLLEFYDVKKEYAKSLDLLKVLQGYYPNDPGLKARIAQEEVQVRGGRDSTLHVDTIAH